MKRKKQKWSTDVAAIIIAKETLKQHKYNKRKKKKRKMLKQKLKELELNQSKETFKPLVGFEGLYEISDKGTIVALERVVGGKNGSKRTLHKRVKATTVNRGGYELIRLCDEYGNNKSYEVHRLVAKTWIPNNYNKPQVNHIDGCKTNNKVSNLEWVTRSENMQHALKEGLIKVGEECSHSKLKEADVIKIRENKANLTQRQLGELFNVAAPTIHKIIKRKIWKHV